MKPTIIVLIGPSCSGKTTWALEYIKQNPGTLLLSRDSERAIRFGNFRLGTKEEEAHITDIINKYTDTAIECRTDVILDNTHLKRKYIDKVTKRYSSKANIVFKRFNADLLTLIKRNQKRFEKTGKLIPLRVLKSQIKNYDRLFIPDNIKHESRFRRFMNLFNRF